MFTIYSSQDKINFEFEEQHPTLPEAVTGLGKWLSIRAMRLDPELSKAERWGKKIKEHWYIFEGKNNVTGILVGSVEIFVHRLKGPKK